MVAGVVHLAAPTAQIMPLKAFKGDGTANLSDIFADHLNEPRVGDARVGGRSQNPRITINTLVR